MRAEIESRPCGHSAPRNVPTDAETDQAEDGNGDALRDRDGRARPAGCARGARSKSHEVRDGGESMVAKKAKKKATKKTAKKKTTKKAKKKTAKKKAAKR